MKRSTIARMNGTAGFALIDLSISVLIGSAILGGFVGMFSSRMNNQHAAESEVGIREARQALVSYAMVHGRLPCPASPAMVSGQPNAGIAGEFKNEECAHGFFGVLPWATLSLPELDAWGNRLAYRVARDMSQTSEACSEDAAVPRSTCLAPPTRTYSSTPTQDALGVRELVWANGVVERTEPIANGLAAVVFSAGPNGALAFNRAGMKRAAVNAIGMEYELKNATPSSVTFYASPADRRGPSCAPGVGAAACGFDDIVAWVSRGEILVALAKAGYQF